MMRYPQKLMLPTKTTLHEQEYVIWSIKNEQASALTYSFNWGVRINSSFQNQTFLGGIPTIFPSHFQPKILLPGQHRFHAFKIERNNAPIDYYLFKLTIQDKEAKQVYDSKAFFITIEE